MASNQLTKNTTFSASTLFQPSEFDAIANSTEFIPTPAPRPGVPQWNIRTESDTYLETLGTNFTLFISVLIFCYQKSELGRSAKSRKMSKNTMRLVI